MRPKVLVCDNIAEEGIRLLEEKAEVEVRTGLKEDELCRAIKGFEAVVVRSATKITRRVIESADRLRVIARAGVGVDNIDLDSATKRGIIVVNSPMGNTIAACEHTLALMLALARNIPQAVQSLKGGRWERKKFMGVELFGKTLGVIGLGKIGSEVAKRAKAFGMRVLVYDPYVPAERVKALGAEPVPFDELLSQSDFITIHVPLTDETRGMIGREALKKVKPGVRIINCSRGGVVDEEALYKALCDGRVAGAALDVFEMEPPDEKGRRLIEHPKVIATPHLGASTEEAQVNVAVDVAEQILDVFEGRPPRSAVNMPSISPQLFEVLRPFLVLCEKMGVLQAHLAEGAIVEASLEYAGRVAEHDTEPLTRAFLRGLLAPAMGGTVNYVNAPVLARERGIKVSESKLHDSPDYASLITTRIVTDKGKSTEVAGTVFGKEDVRIVSIDGYRIDVVPEGYMLFAPHRDRPGIIGRVGTILGKRNINIAGMQLGRKEVGGRAIMALNVDDRVPEDALEEIRETPDIFEVKQVCFSV
ncbi:MAG TPA: phosphoglycerate dehydrogenase [Armatimonadetes bacterium]|nr:phosphoglycerate dehydrogenase [Armatimonadota bacterium]